MTGNRITRIAALPVLAVLALQGCAYNRPPEVTAQMTRTEALLEQADSSGVEKEALPELQHARDKYAQAKTAYEKESESGDDSALRLAREAEVDVRYASAKADAIRQQQAATEVERAVQDLRAEARRNAAPTPASSTY